MDRLPEHFDADDFLAGRYSSPPPPDLRCIAGCVVISWVFALGIIKAVLQLCGLW